MEAEIEVLDVAPSEKFSLNNYQNCHDDYYCCYYYHTSYYCCYYSLAMTSWFFEPDRNRALSSWRWKKYRNFQLWDSIDQQQQQEAQMCSNDPPEDLSLLSLLLCPLSRKRPSASSPSFSFREGSTFLPALKIRPETEVCLDTAAVDTIS